MVAHPQGMDKSKGAHKEPYADRSEGYIWIVKEYRKCIATQPRLTDVRPPLSSGK